MKKLLMLAFVLGFLFFLCYLAAKGIHAYEPGNACNTFGIQRLDKKPAPVFSLKDLAGNQVSLTSFKGRPVLIVFWATW